MVIFDPQRQLFAFYTNPKSGVTTTRGLLSDLLHEPFTRHDRVESGSVLNHKQVLFVLRNPYERVVSMFFRFTRVLWTSRHSEERRRSVTERVLAQYGRMRGFTFPEFLQYLKDTPNVQRDEHYRSQDIPLRYDVVILTHRYRDDLLAYFKQISYEKGVEALLAKDNSQIRKNHVSCNWRRSWGDVLSLSGLDFQKCENTGYPPHHFFLKEASRAAIDTIFSKEVLFYRSLRES